MKMLGTMFFLAVALLALAGCPEKKPEGESPASATAATASPKPGGSAPAKGGW